MLSHDEVVARPILIEIARIILPSLCFAVATVTGPIGLAVAQPVDGAAAAAGTATLSYERVAFDAADLNSDGLVSEAELARDAAVGFSSLDKDRSGTLTRKELGSHDPAKFSRIDTNGDGVLSFSEVMVNKTRALAAGDKNNDGGLSFEEMVDAVKVDEGVDAMRKPHEVSSTRLKIALLGVVASLALAGCETTGGGTAPVGVGTIGGAAAGAGTSRLLFGDSTAGMLIGAAAGGLAGNMTLDRQAENRRAQEVEASRDANCAAATRLRTATRFAG